MERSALLHLLFRWTQTPGSVRDKETQELSICLSFLLQESALKANRFSQSVKVVHDRLHLQIQKRKAENDKLKEHVKVMNIHFYSLSNKINEELTLTALLNCEIQ